MTVLFYFICERGTVIQWKIYERGTICQCKVYERGIFSAKNGISKGKGSDLGLEPTRIKFFLVAPPPPPSDGKSFACGS